MALGAEQANNSEIVLQLHLVSHCAKTAAFGLYLFIELALTPVGRGCAGASWAN